MNNELEMENSARALKVDTKEADRNRKEGDSEINTSCITCKFKPNFHDAIPFYQLAADSYRSAHKFNDEIYCRQKLVLCFRNLKSIWEEGSEQEKIAGIYLNNLKKYDLAIKSINNAFKCYFDNAEYYDALNALLNTSNKLIELKEIEQAENCLKIGYDCFKSVFHVLATKKDQPNFTIYNALYQYFNILVKNNKIKSGIESCEAAIKTIEPFEQDKSKIVETYVYLLIFLLLDNDLIEFKNKMELARRHCDKSSDLRFLQDVESIPFDIENSQENQFKNHTVEIKVRFPNEINKRLNEYFYEMKNKKVLYNGRFKKQDKNDDERDVIINEEEKEIDEYL